MISQASDTMRDVCNIPCPSGLWDRTHSTIGEKPRDDSKRFVCCRHQFGDYSPLTTYHSAPAPSCLNQSPPLKYPGSNGEWCNGSTADSGSACLGSNPSSPVFLLNDISSDRLQIEPSATDSSVGGTSVASSEVLFFCKGDHSCAQPKIR